MAYGKCFLCGKYTQVEEHHAFPGPLRDKSDRYGATVDLCALECHREGKKAVHKCKESRLKVQKYCQKKVMREQRWTMEQWIWEFGRNYLDEEEVCQSVETEETVSERTKGGGELFGFRMLEPVPLMF